MSRIPIRCISLLRSHTQTNGKNKNVKSETKTYIKYSKLDRTKIKKCSRCKHFVDLISEGWSKTELCEYSKLTEQQASETSYVCKYCDSTKFLNDIFEIQYEANADKLERQYNEIAKDIGEKALQKYKEVGEYAFQVLDQHTDVFKDRLNELKENVSNSKILSERLTAQSEELEQKISDINEKLREYATRNSHVASSQSNSTPNTTNRNRNRETEFHNRYKRRNRVVFIGIPNEVDDIDFIIDLAKELKFNINKTDILKTFRINARNIPVSKTQPLNVEFCNLNDKIKFLSPQTKEKLNSLFDQSIFKDVKCFPDRTLKQREKYKSLKLEMYEKNQLLASQNICTEKYIVKNMALTKINITNVEK